MSGKITGHWPQGRSTSRPIARVLVIAPGGPFISKPTVDAALTLSGDERADFIDWLLDDRRKDLMMADWYRSEMREAIKGMPFAFEHPWMTDEQKWFTRYVIREAERQGVEI